MIKTLWDYFKMQVLPNLLVASVFATTAMLWNIKAQLDKIEVIDQRITHLEQEIAVVKSQMITWDLLKRIELSLTTMSQMGKGNQGMQSVANVIHNEIEARKDK